MLQHPLRPTVRGSRGFQATARRATIVQATKDRVLRYPDGNVRHIRYPISESMVEDEDDVGGAWDVATYWGSSPARPQPSAAAAASCDARASNAEAAQPFSSSVRSSSEPTTPSTSGSPSPSLSDTAAYLDSLFGSSYAAAQPQIDIDHCFKVLDGCPWLIPRPVYVLTMGELRPGEAFTGSSSSRGIQLDGSNASSSDEGLVGSTYTLRTKVVQQEAAGQLAKLLGKPHLSSALEVAHMRDGVVVFETPDAAAIYATRLEEEGETKVTVAEVDSHKLFRLASDSKALVVLVIEGEEGELPAPFQLAAALKGKKAWDDM